MWRLLEEFGDKRVYSFDHVAINDKVTVCDMKTVPLPDEAIDIAVFSLSLMGRNWSDYIAEAKRCLATNGYLLMAECLLLEISSRKKVSTSTPMKKKETSRLLKLENFDIFDKYKF